MVNIVFRISTCTVGRETQYGITCGPVIFVDEQRLLVNRNLELNTLADFSGRSICVLGNTTSDDLLKAGFMLKDETSTQRIEVTPVPANGTGKLTANAHLKELYEKQECDAVFGTIPRLIDLRNGLINKEEYIFVDETISTEPMTPYIVAKDEQWRKVVEYTIHTILYAEQIGITQADVEKKCNTITDAVPKEWFLGTDDLPERPFFGEDIGLEKGFACRIIESVGNYGEIYDDYLSSYLDKRGFNRVWELGNTGGLYTPPLTPP
ncbi:hypothetical protein KFU94_21135 [Chloroflexi bacterium TSY]|nr:hypothetical protein [Chloroflexi bacterium TSY]